METRCFSLPSDCNTHGITNSGSFCIQKTLLPTSSIYCMETRLEYYSNRSIPRDKRENGFTFPPFSMINRVLRKVLKEKIDHLIIVKPTQQTRPWYAQLPKMSVQLTISSASDKKIVKKSTRQNSFFSRNKVTEISDVERFWESLQMELIPSNIAKLISNSR